MRLLLLLSLVTLVLTEEATDSLKLADVNDVPEQTTAILDALPSSEESSEEKKLDKRGVVSFGISSLPYPLLYGSSYPSYSIPWSGLSGISYRTVPVVYPTVKVAPVYTRVITVPAISAIGYGGWKW